MKRHHPQIRPPGWNSSDQDQSEDEDQDFSLPSARKLLKRLLVNEVDRAIRDLNQEDTSFDRSKNHRAASLIPEFDPDGDDCKVSAWLKKIDQLGDIHDWDDKIKAFHLQDKLRSQARKWYNRLEDYNYSWEEWKNMLMRAFPKHRDYSVLLDEMMQRTKLNNETMTRYYQDKVAMCFRCKLSDSASVSCIIRGLPAQLQPNARAFQCKRPDELYESSSALLTTTVDLHLHRKFVRLIETQEHCQFLTRKLTRRPIHVLAAKELDTCYVIAHYLTSVFALNAANKVTSLLAASVLVQIESHKRVLQTISKT
ncbi:hypothetical protein PYW08_013018 [Mythimna loreyi]|uniref:Uncharacterized protein n=1 Tax=Mythimna loreyi TaxID=667449 RepID=A0ACC2Q3X0_9NEOP|nr:hypothetical protein PYW08_013018 [Mythimna loreyi]